MAGVAPGNSAPHAPRPPSAKEFLGRVVKASRAGLEVAMSKSSEKPKKQQKQQKQKTLKERRSEKRAAKKLGSR